MQLHELPQKFSDIALTLGTSNCAGNLFLHQDATPRAEPTTTDAMASFPEHKLFRLFGLAYEAGVQVLGHVLRQFHLDALTSEHAFLLFQSVTAFRAVHCEDCSRSWRKWPIKPTTAVNEFNLSNYGPSTSSVSPMTGFPTVFPMTIAARLLKSALVPAAYSNPSSTSRDSNL